jgi:hypothetical protein
MMTTIHTPALMEVFGEDGEATFVPTAGARDEDIQASIDLLEGRIASIRADIAALRRLKRSGAEVDRARDEIDVEATLRLFRRTGQNLKL